MIFLPNQQFELDWRLPPRVNAVAIGTNRVVLREEGVTTLHDLDGTPIRTRELPRWDEGYFANRMLFLARSPSSTEGHALWIVKADTLDVMWYCTEEDGTLILR